MQGAGQYGRPGRGPDVIVFGQISPVAESHPGSAGLAGI